MIFIAIGHGADVDGRRFGCSFWPHVSIILPYAVIGVVFATASAAYLNILQLGDEITRPWY